MDGDRTDGVIDLGHVVEEIHGEDHQDTGNDTDDGSAERVNHVAAGGDGDEACQRAVEGQGDIGLP